MAVVNVTDAAAVALFAPTGRKTDFVAYVQSGTAYLDKDSAVTSTSGVPLAAGGYISGTVGEQQTIYARCATGGSAEVRVLPL